MRASGYFEAETARVAESSALHDGEKITRIKALRSQAADLLRASSASQSVDRQIELEAIDELLATLFPG
jgi:hypothetical protein